MYSRIREASPKGIQLIAAKWTKHAKAAPFTRNDVIQNVLPVGVLVFPDNGIQENLAGKASRLGIPVLKFEWGP